MKQKFIFCKNGNILIRTGVYEEILKRYNPTWIDIYYSWRKND